MASGIVPAAPWRALRGTMRRTVLIAAAAGVAVLLIVLLLLGAFPPRARVTAVQHVIPNDHFQTR